jgi:hypothetical protein
VKKASDSAFRKAANSRRTPLAVLVTTMVVLGIAISTGAAALATDTRHDTTSSNDTTSNHTTSTTSTGTTSTVTTTSTTVSVAPITGAGGQAGAVGGGKGGGGQAGGAGQAVQAAPSESQLAFTGVHVPALILIALGMIAGGIVLRRKLEDVA